MKWNWQLKEWPSFIFDPEKIGDKERQFLLNVGGTIADIQNINPSDQLNYIIEILSEEGLKSSKIEGEFLERESLRSSLKKHFGLSPSSNKVGDKEAAMALMLIDVFNTYEAPLTHQMLKTWHQLLFKGDTSGIQIGKYRSHVEPMQIVSNRMGDPIVYFEAPPSKQVSDEMTRFIEWFNRSSHSSGILSRAAIAHLYFESIHPFEDGNGRIGRALIEKALSQGVGKKIPIALSKVIEKRKKEYYHFLQLSNRTLQVQPWVDFFAEVVLEAERGAKELCHFLLQKGKVMTQLSRKMNVRQEKVILRMFQEGPSGFKGGLSAENYLAITKTSRATATRDLKELVEWGALVKTGELRHTRYWLNFNLFNELV
jgi:Fic family protein